MIEGIRQALLFGLRWSFYRGLRHFNSAGAAHFTLSDDRPFRIRPARYRSVSEETRTLTWVDREGRETPLPVPDRAMRTGISPDGNRVALDIRDQEADIWLWDLSRQSLTLIHVDLAADIAPIWTRDGRTIVFSRAGEGIFRQAADGTGHSRTAD